MSEPNAIETLADALQGFVNEDADEAGVILGAVVVFEVTRFNDTGEQTHSINYTIPAPQTSMAAAVGLLDAGLHIVRRDALAYDDESDDE